MCIIKLNEVYKPKKNYTVIVKTITFNHSKYIEDALNGIAMQNTNFPFVNIVLEDNSTDGEQDVIRIWLDRECDMSLAEYYDIPTAILIIAPHKKNINCTFAIYFHKKNLFQQINIRESQVHPWRYNSKYEALCEGDDYWIDPLKLQKQVDVMDKDSTCSLCHSAFYFNDVTPENLFKNSIYNHKIDVINGIIGGNQYRVQTNTTLYRTRQLKDILESDSFLFNSSYFLMGDTQLWIALLQVGNISYIESPTAIYRVLQGSACRNNNIVKKFRFDLSCSELRLYLIDKYNIKYGEKKQLVNEYNKNLLRYRLFDLSFKPLYRPTFLFQFVFCLLIKTGFYRLFQNKLLNKYKNGNF